MIEPKSVEIDTGGQIGYIRYTDAAVAGTVDVWRDGQVAADIDDGGHVIGIEILSLDNATLTEAEKFAASKGLVFPGDLRRPAP